MINGAHLLIYTTDPDADRAFMRDVLGFPSVDAGGGWLIFALPPGEVAFHPAERQSTELYLMCDDLKATIASLEEKNVRCTEVHTERWGIRTTITLPSGGAIGLYQPTHKTAI
jgi:catechol 2,3-dioxygenase-like lactoylglutathione lyase family enzyme